LVALVKEHGKDDTMVLVTGDRAEPAVARAKPTKKSAGHRVAQDRSVKRHSRVYREMSVSANRYYSRRTYRGFRMPVADMPSWWLRM
jgi:hypothetical protein